MSIISMYQNANETLKAALTEEEFVSTVYRVEDLLRRFSDHGVEYDDNLTYDEEAIALNILEWGTNKATKIKAFKASPLFNPKDPWKIVLTTDMAREIDDIAIYTYAEDFAIENKLEYSNFVSRLIRQYCHQFITEEESGSPRDLSWYKSELECGGNNFYGSTVYMTKEEAKKLRETCMPHNGQKVSKFVRKVITTLGYKVNERDYAKYADAINPLTVKREAVLSIDPCDFLLMSNGNSWSSCYTINKYWNGETYEGCYSRGTWSYMTDIDSMIMYVLPDSEKEWCVNNNQTLDKGKKMFRQVVMFNDEDLILHSRLYPQSMDCCGTEEYKILRNAAQQLIADMYHIPNYWATVKEDTGYNETEYRKQGTNFTGYPDPYYFPHTISIFKPSKVEAEEGKKAFKKITYGSKAYCPCCGEVLYNGDDRYVCEKCDKDDKYYVCADCGRRLDEDEAYYCQDAEEYYCENCCHWCEYHEEYEHFGSTEYVENYGNVCIEALSNSSDFFYCEDCCTWYSYNNQHENWIEDYRPVCDRCFDSGEYAMCNDCNNNYQLNDLYIGPDEECYCHDCYCNLISQWKEEYPDFEPEIVSEI